MKVVCGLGNPGPAYERTRHNVAWWVLEAARTKWGFPGFRRMGPSAVSDGQLGVETVVLQLPLTYVNRSGAAVGPWLDTPGFDPARDLLVVVDDVALEVGRVRIRAAGSSGGHNGLKSIEATLDTQEYARLRIGVGIPAAGVDLVDWVLSPLPDEDQERVIGLLPELVDAIGKWVEEGVESAARSFSR
jgi:peptidyl-tRNA hydrolase, PTH1 family